MWQNSKQNLYKLKLYFKKFMIFFKTKQHPIFGCEIMIDFFVVVFPQNVSPKWIFCNKFINDFAVRDSKYNNL